MSSTLDVENADDLVAFLRRTGRVEPGETPAVTLLAGGISNRTVLVRRSSGESWVIKQALEKLRVAMDWFASPERVHREALALRWLAILAPEGSTVSLVFEDHENHLIAMGAVPEPHENWKSLLLGGGLRQDHVLQFGRLLGSIHRRAFEMAADVAPVFNDRSFFESLRLQPYYLTAAECNPSARRFLDELVEETRATQLTFVHGDYSPKNILVHSGRLILLDHEVAHFGDPAFDIGFALTHLLSKAHHLTNHRAEFLAAAECFWMTYLKAAGDLAASSAFRGRSVRHLLACLLARVDGRSPLEYLSASERDRQRAVVLRLIHARAADPLTLFPRFERLLSEHS